MFGWRSAAVMKVLLDSKQIEQILDDLASQIISMTPHQVGVATISIRNRGEILAQRLSQRLSNQLGKEVPCGTLDITLYRDDLNSPQGTSQPKVQTTEIGFDIDNKIIRLYRELPAASIHKHSQLYRFWSTQVYQSVHRCTR